MDTTQSITGNAEPTLPRPVAVRIEKLRRRLFDAMAFVETTERALEHDEQLSERMTLQTAYKVMDKVASELNQISGVNGPIEEETEEAQS